MSDSFTRYDPTPVELAEFVNIGVGGYFVGPAPSGTMWVCTTVDTLFYGDGGGGHLICLGPGGAVFNFTQPAGGTEAGAGYRGWIVLNRGQSINVQVVSGHFDVTLTGWAYPVTP